MESPLLRTKVGNSLRISATTTTTPPPTHIATCRCRSNLSPPTLVVAAPAPPGRKLRMDYNFRDALR
jgi:hypothetical protein